MVWFPAAVRKIGKVDVDFFKNALKEVPEDIWRSDQRRITNSNFYDSYSLWLRFLPRTNFGNDETFHVFENNKFNHPEFEKNCRNFQENFEKEFNGTIIRNCIIRLFPTQHINKHLDGSENLHLYCNRLIIPIITNPQVVMFYQETPDYPSKEYILEEGDVYDTNGFIPHSVTNNGRETRYAFVMDFLQNETIHSMTVNIYKEWTSEFLAEMDSKGKRKKFNPNMSAPLVDISTQWLDRYNAQKEKYYGNITKKFGI